MIIAECVGCQTTLIDKGEEQKIVQCPICFCINVLLPHAMGLALSVEEATRRGYIK